MKMKFKKIAILVTVAFISMGAYGQLFHPLGLGDEKCEWEAYYSQPQMHIDGNNLYVCTNQGLYVKDISSDNSLWQLSGYEGIPIQDFAKRGNDIIALRDNYNGNFLLLSHNGGKTYEDITPDLFTVGNATVIMVINKLIQHPSDSNIL